MKLHRLVAENFKKLKVVEIKFPERGVVHVTGRNAQGKTSLLEAVAAAVAQRRQRTGEITVDVQHRAPREFRRAPVRMRPDSR